MDLTLPTWLKRIFSHEEDRDSRMNASEKELTAERTDERPPATRVLQPAHTVRLRPEPEEEALPLLTSFGITDRGRQREGNEDSYSVLTLEDSSLFVVADGMGGHACGEVASRTAVDTVCRVIREERFQYDDPLRLVEQALVQANDEVRSRGVQERTGMGTTLCVAFLSGNQAFIGNVGDSRAYWIKDGSLTQITIDHSLVAKLTAAGKLTKEEARVHPQANLLYRTIGNDETITIDTFRVDLTKGGTLLLCTDGLWGEVDDEEIQRICASGTGAKDTVQRLVVRANAHGGKDNITAVVVQVRETEMPPQNDRTTERRRDSHEERTGRTLQDEQGLSVDDNS